MDHYFWHRRWWVNHIFTEKYQNHPVVEFNLVNIPPRPCGRASADLRGKIFSDEKNAMIFSNKMAEAFKEAGVTLDDDETYMCLVCAVEKPRYTSEAISLDPLLVVKQDGSRVNYVMEPAIMKSVVKHIAKDEIK